MSKCVDCIHNHTIGCARTIDMYNYEYFTSKQGNHELCFVEYKGHIPKEYLDKRQKAKQEMRRY